ncbi:hypothetical protein IWW54_002195 [Coemansia sp. RSA 2705]|nr:hypothetical protein IWW54_002195 [Coemansia sp. RSA 2705]
MVQVFVYPPLGALTSVHGPRIAFRVYFAYGSTELVQRDAVEVWTDIYGDEWQGVPLEPDRSAAASPEHAFLDLEQLHSTVCVQQFSLDIAIASLPSSLCRFEFTVRWRSGSAGEWQWVSGFEHNARVAIFRPLPQSRAPVSFWRQQLKPLLQPADPLDSGGPGFIADSWQASSSGASCLLKPLGSGTEPLCRLAAIERYLAYVRKDQFWIIPQSGASLLNTGDFDVVLLLLELSSGVYAALMPFSLGSAVSHAAVLRIQPLNTICAVSVSRVRAESVRVAMGFSLDPHNAVQEAMLRIQQSLPVASNSSNTLSEQTPIHPCSLTRNRGYCTWNGFYQNVTHDSLVSMVSDIRRANSACGQLPFSWVLIDDGWQSVDKYDGFGRLRDICANTEKFPGQLRQTVESLSKLGVGRVGVWHTLWGYWGGIDPTGPLAGQYTLVKCHRAWSPVVKGESDVWLISSKSVHRFYDDFYSWLSEQGVTFVKVDYQAAFESLDSYADKPSDESRASIADMHTAHYDAMEQAALRHFGAGSIIYCMAQSPHLISRTLRRQQLVADNAATEHALFRNSDDYFPDVAASHSWHIYCNLANTVWSRCLDKVFVIDWDMFQPGRAESRIHAAARMVSGGPVYMTGRAADFAVTSTYNMGGSNSVIPHFPPLIDRDCLFADMTKVPAILASTIAVPANASVVIAVFNLAGTPAVTPLPLCSIYSAAVQRHDQAYRRAPSPSTPRSTQLGAVNYLAIYQKSTNRLLVEAATPELFAIALSPLTCDTLTMVQMQPLRTSDQSAVLHAACLGDVTRYVGTTVIERNVHSVLPASPGTNSPTYAHAHGGQRQWNVRVRVAAGICRLSFVLCAYDTTPDIYT